MKMRILRIREHLPRVPNQKKKKKKKERSESITDLCDSKATVLCCLLLLERKISWPHSTELI